MKPVAIFSNREDLGKKIVSRLEKMGYPIGGIHIDKGGLIEGIKINPPELVIFAIIPEGEGEIPKIAREIRDTFDIPVVLFTRKVDEVYRGFIMELEPDAFIKHTATDIEIALTLELTVRRHKRVKFPSITPTKEEGYDTEVLEKLGLFANKVGHDFNNFLMAIMGYASMIKMKPTQGALQEEYLNKILGVVDKAKVYTGDLLSFGRRKAGDLLRINLNQTVNSIAPFLKDMVNRQDIRISLSLTGEDLYVMANPTQLHQVISNIVKNSCDAMPEGGEIIIKTEGVLREQGTSYALLSIKDTGIGMDESVRQRIFEPFFTTKEPGKGVGLGLSIVYGIIKQHNGFIEVISEPGKGTTLYIYLPA
ncbi:MAG: ATP-binding protein [Syntrophorhabdaceae bacterium]|nr:ATP-binding protein [Syntrophorhabdaceae bacterium]